MDLMSLIRLVANNGGWITIAVVVIGSSWGPISEDDFRRPREIYAALFGKGSSNGRGDIPRE